MSDRLPAVGAWRASVDIPGAPAGLINLATFSRWRRGRRISIAHSGGSQPWAPTRILDAGAGSLGEHGAPIGTHRIAATVQADADGQALSGAFTITIAENDGATQGSVSGSINASRITSQRRPLATGSPIVPRGVVWWCSHAARGANARHYGREQWVLAPAAPVRDVSITNRFMRQVSPLPYRRPRSSRPG